jgi:XisI protein
MENLTPYQIAIQTILSEYAEYMATSGELSLQTLFDTKNNHYQILVLGWQGNKRIYNNLLHLDIIDGKIWVQNNNTQFTLVEDFERFSIAKQDIVNGLIPARRRKFSAFAVA